VDECIVYEIHSDVIMQEINKESFGYGCLIIRDMEVRDMEVRLVGLFDNRHH